MSVIELRKKTILVTGAGSIGANLVKRLYQDIGDVRVVGIDDLNEYYDVRLKKSRLDELSAYPSLVFIRGNIADTCIDSLFAA